MSALSTSTALSTSPPAAPDQGRSPEPVFLIEDPLAVWEKLQCFTGIWQRRLERFIQCAHVRGRGEVEAPYPLHAAFLYALTGNRSWASLAADNLRWLKANYARLVATGRPDNDTWMHAAPMFRRAIGLDWVWDSGALTPGELEELAELFVSDALKYPYVVLHHRIPAHGNNQGLAQATALVVVGYLFGWRRGADPRAKHLLRFGMHHLLQQIALLPRGGYGSEGGTYAAGIESPLAAQACATLSAIYGDPLLDRRFAPSGSTLRHTLEQVRRFETPSGLLIPWNQYGYQGGWGLSAGAYLAQQTGDLSWYGRALVGDGWERSAGGAWLRDDHVWQLLFMPPPPDPADMPASITPFNGEAWSEPSTGGSLQDERHRLCLTQMWSWSSMPPSRTHMHPNNIVAEAWGSPLLIDGHATPDFSLSRRLANRVKPESEMARYIASWWAPGSIGAHSCLIVDDAIEMTSTQRIGWTQTGETAQGRLVRHRVSPDLSDVAADVTAFYAGRFADIREVRRVTALVDQSWWIVGDQVSAARPHRYVQQLVLREGAHLTPWGARLRTPEHVVLDVVSLGESADQIEQITGYPSVLERRCHHFRRTVTGVDLNLWTVLLPRLGRELVSDLSDGWEGVLDCVDEGMPARHIGRRPTTWSDLWYQLPPAGGRNCTATFTRSLELPKGPGTWLLQLPRAYRMRVFLGDIELSVREQHRHHHGEPALLPPFVKVDEQLVAQLRRKGPVAVLRLELSEFGDHPVSGPIALHRMIEPLPPEVRIESGDVIVGVGGAVSVVKLADLDTRGLPMVSLNEAGEQPGPVADAVAAHIDALPDAGTAQSSSAWHIVTRAISQPADVDPQTRGQLVDLLAAPDWTLRLLAIKALGVCKASQGVAPLISLIKGQVLPGTPAEGVLRTQMMAVWALGRIGDRAAVESVGELIKPGHYYGMRRLAAEALGLIGCRSGEPFLQLGSRDTDPETAHMSAVGLAALRGRRA